MKQYKVFSYEVNSFKKLENLLNREASNGWYIKTEIQNGNLFGGALFIYLLEREITEQLGEENKFKPEEDYK